MKGLFRKILVITSLITIGLKVFAGVAQAQAQVGLTPTGATRTSIPGVTVANSSVTETSLLATGAKDTLIANSLTTGSRPYHAYLFCKITTPTVSLPALTLKFKIGTATVTVASGVSLLGSVTDAPFLIEVWVIPTKVLNVQQALIFIQQNGQSTLALNPTNSTAVQTLNMDASLMAPIDFTATYSGATLGTANITSLAYIKQSF